MKLSYIPDLQIEHWFIKTLTEDAEVFYRHKNKVKMKFGRPQLDQNGSKKIRNVVEPVPLLKNKQNLINNYIQNLELPNSMFGGIKDRNNILNALEHVNSKYFLTIDLKNYFNNITNKQIHQTLVNYNFSWEEARIVTKMTTYMGSLPQGAPTSTPLANLVFASTAAELEKFCSGNEITFTNFVDDLTFSSKLDFACHVPYIKGVLKQNGFFINYNKIHYRKHSCEITGLWVRNGRLHLEKEMLQHLEKPGVRAYALLVAKTNNKCRKPALLS